MIHVIQMKRICYGKFNSFRISKIGIQEIDQLYQFQKETLFT
ncbi:MAG: hypothetical protein PHY47_24150 [Lachnospiraceae bacterium]|nr:hypothetical protein [Lachnospiraceae bacterium]